jgi:hypothetical protein
VLLRSRCLDQRPCKPLATFGQSRRTTSKICDYREHAIASEVCNSDTRDMLAFWRSAPIAIALVKAVVVETLNHGGRLVGDRTTTGAGGLFAVTDAGGLRVDVIVASFLPSRCTPGSLIVLAPD